MCSNRPASPAYVVYISQLIRSARTSSNYSDFLKRHLHPFHYGSKSPAVTITVFITILEQKRQISCQSGTKLSEVNVKDTFTSHIDKKIVLHFCWHLIFIHFHYVKIHCYKYCYSDSRRLWAVMKGGGLAL
jgi:hypothetical protein